MDVVKNALPIHNGENPAKRLRTEPGKKSVSLGSNEESSSTDPRIETPLSECTDTGGPRTSQQNIVSRPFTPDHLRALYLSCTVLKQASDKNLNLMEGSNVLGTIEVDYSNPLGTGKFKKAFPATLDLSDNPSFGRVVNLVLLESKHPMTFVDGNEEFGPIALSEDRKTAICIRGNEFNYAKVCSFKSLINLCGKYLLAVQMFWDSGNVHLDIKPENMLMRTNSNGDQIVALTDVDDSKKVGDSLNSIVGTPGFIPAEMVGLSTDKKTITVNKLLDANSLAKTMVQLITFRPFITFCTDSEIDVLEMDECKQIEEYELSTEEGRKKIKERLIQGVYNRFDIKEPGIDRHKEGLANKLVDILFPYLMLEKDRKDDELESLEDGLLNILGDLEDVGSDGDFLLRIAHEDRLRSINSI